MPADGSAAAAETIARHVVAELGYAGDVEDLLGADPVALPEAIDSRRLMSLVTFAEDTFDIEIDDCEIIQANFATVSALVALVAAKGALPTENESVAGR